MQIIERIFSYPEDAEKIAEYDQCFLDNILIEDKYIIVGSSHVQADDLYEVSYLLTETPA